MADRNATTYRKEVGNVAAILQDAKAIDGSELDINQFVISKDSAQRSRQKVRKSFTETFYKNFSPPRYIAVHWDEKFCKQVLGQDYGQGSLLCFCLESSMRKVY